MNKLSLIIIYSITIFILFLFSMFFSSADMAYGSVSDLRIKKYISDNPKSKNAKRALKLVENYDATISTILFINDLVNIGIETISALLGYAVAQYIGFDTPALFSAFASLIILVLVIVFGEIMPKSLAKSNSFKFSLYYSSIINICYYIFIPITFITSKFANLVTKPLLKHNKKTEVTDEELEEMVDVIEKEGVVDKDNAEIIRGTIDYASTEAYEIMTPRVDLFAISVKDNLEDIFKDERIFIHSRIPVYKDTIDDIIGFVRTKDLIRVQLENKNLEIENIIQPVLRFPRSVEINDILKSFKVNKIHFAVINDEYGGVDGIVTMEDILEEIVGEIWDEQDEVDEPIRQIDDYAYIVDGSMNLIDFFEEFEIDPESIDTEYVTIGGFCIELLDDRFAKVGDVIRFKNLILKVIAIDESNTIYKLRVNVETREED